MSEINKYQNGKIYKLWSLETDEIYIGSTCQPLHKRMHKHREAVQYTKKNYKLYQEMRRCGQHTFNIELIENYPCNSKDELIKREGYWIREIKATLNMIIAGRTKREYAEEHKEQNKMYGREYRRQNADRLKEHKKEYLKQNENKIKEYKKEYQKQNADKIRQHKQEYYKHNTERISEHNKEYYSEHIDRIKERRKEHYKQNADKMRERQSEQHMCSVCGSTYTYGHKSRHERTQKHLKALEELNKSN